MQIRVVTDQPWDLAADVLAVPIVADEPTATWAAEVAELDRRTEGGLAAFRTFGELASEAHATALIPGHDIGASWLLAVGMERLDCVDRIAILRYGATAERRLCGRTVTRLAVWLPDWLRGRPGIRADDVAMLVTRGVLEGGYDPRTIYREHLDQVMPVLDELILVAPGADAASLYAAAERGRVIAEGSKIARDLANTASNDISPAVLADAASDLAREHGLAIDILDIERARELGMGMFVAVGRGSDNPPRLIVLRNGPEGTIDGQGRLLALVGKGVTFDSGGISIKPADRMEEMKMDKTGAATVIAAMATVKRLAPDLPLLALAPAVENMPGPHSTRPGDIVRALNGKVVEIQNTDAEGRLILGDALTYAEQLGATHLVDVATLTGAVERAFGKLVTGAFGEPQEWFDAVAAAGARHGERYVQIPLIDDYERDLESWYADIQNTGTADGSLVKSGLFLREFVTRPWVHLDIGGSAYLRRHRPWSPRGATGVTHATLVELALQGA